MNISGSPKFNAAMAALKKLTGNGDDYKLRDAVIDEVEALQGVCRNHEGTISVMNEGLRATMAREDLLVQQVATLTAERDAAREEVAMGRKAMGILAFELERMKAERDAARQQLEDLAYSHSLCGDLRDECINAETEACAQLANWHLNNIERLRPSANDGWLKGYRDACADLESAIRARGAK